MVKKKHSEKKKILLLLGGFFLVDLIIAYILHFSIIASTCMTIQQVQTDNRCLYIANNQVYQKDSRSSPHHGHPCGTDITSVLPSSHLKTPASYLIPNYVANICPPASPTLTPSLTPTVPPTATSTPTSGSISFAITVFLHDIGSGGDNVNPNVSGNQNPVHMTRTFIMTVFNGNNQIVATQQGTVIFDRTSGNFTGTITIPSLANGSYTISIETDSFLKKLLPGFVQINQARTYALPAVYLVAGDMNNDAQLDLSDYNILIGCFGTKQNTASCTKPPTQQTPGADLNDDALVDGIDYNIFLRELSVQRGV